MLLKQFQSIEKSENGYLIHGDNADVNIVFMSDDIIRIRTSFDRKFKEASYALVTTAWEDELDELFKNERTRIKALEVPYEETDKKVVFTTAKWKLILRKNPFSFQLQDHKGNVVYKDLKERAYEVDQLGRLSHYSCIDPVHDHFYGFGEKTGKLDKKGRRMRMSPKDAIGHDPEFGEPLYKHIPFYIRINDKLQNAVGFFYNNSHDSVFDMGNEISGYWDRYCYYQTDGGDIDLFLIAGPKVTDVIDGYTWLTGRTAMPTKQSLGYTASTMYYTELEKDCDQEIYKVIQKHFDEKIFIDNFWLASGYSSGEEDNLRYTFNWHHKRFPNPEEFFKNMRDMGINVIPNMKPGILKNHPYMDEFKKNDIFVKTSDRQDDYHGRWWGGVGRFIDFTGESGRNTWKEFLKETLLKKGSMTVWNDNCEFDGVEDRNAYCDNNGRGGTMAELKIIHSNMMAYIGKQALAEIYPNERPYIINRAGFSGIQRYAQVWGGDNLTDWRTVKFNIATILGMGLSGVANMGCDIGGFAGPAPEGELMLRWIQNGIFQPRFCMNSANSDNTVTQPWMYEEHLEDVRAAFAQRYRMLPYLYSLMRQAHESGIPAMRPLFLEFPEDPNCYSDDHMTFMFGPSVLVANVVEKGAKARKLYLPKGTAWFDMNDNLRQYEGGQTIEIPVTLSSIPMFLRGSAIYMTTEDVHQASTDIMRQLDLIISAEKDSSFLFYDDDGHTKDFEKGIFNRTEISVSSGEKIVVSFHKEGDYKDTIEKLTLRVVSKEKGACWVSVDGNMIPRFLVRKNLEEAESGWYYNLSDRTVEIKCPKPDKNDFDIVVSCEKFDLIGMEQEEEL
ncbi:MAG: TIM-barrel domain-containing protein [Clostridiaceae bacterium]